MGYCSGYTGARKQRCEDIIFDVVNWLPCNSVWGLGVNYPGQSASREIGKIVL